MRLKLILIIAISIVLFSCQKSNKVIIHGQFKDVKEKYVYLADFDLVSTHIIDSCKFKKDGKFKFKTKTSEPALYQIILNSQNSILLLLKPGEEVNLNANASNINNTYTVEGSEGSEQVKMLNKKLGNTIQSLDSLVVLNNTYSKTSTNKTDTILKHINSEYVAILKAQRNFSIRFIIQHLNSMASVVALYQQYPDNNFVLAENRDLQYVKLVSDTLQKYYPQSKVVKVLTSDKNKLLGAYNAYKISLLADKSKALSFPDIALPDMLGNTMHLDELKNKCILINFWGVENNDSYYVLKGLTDLNTKYNKKGLSIFNIALGNKFEEWSEFIKTNKIPGINVIDLRAENSVYLSTLNIHQLPSSFLLGPGKTFIDRDLFGEKLEDKIQEILK